MKKFAFIILFTTGLIACSKDKSGTVPSNVISDYFIIGHSPGFINVMTYNYYKIQENFVFKADILINGQYIYSSIPLSNYKILIAKQAIDNLTQYLINNPNQYFGNRDFADQATYYVEMNKNNIKTYWILDPTATSVPAEVQNYVQLLANIISQL